MLIFFFLSHPDTQVWEKSQVVLCRGYAEDRRAFHIKVNSGKYSLSIFVFTIYEQVIHLEFCVIIHVISKCKNCCLFAFLVLPYFSIFIYTLL